MKQSLYRDIIERLDGANVANDVQLLVLAALTGELHDALGGRAPTEAETSDPSEDTDAPGIYLHTLTVEGFRGIGPPATLEIAPGPGLTLILGRNGSGKSSFAEALELLVTDANYRWAQRSKIWRDGWRNLHHPTAAIAAVLHAEGDGQLRLQRTWDGDADLDDAQTELVRAGAKPQPNPWHGAITAYRPFLSYNELGAMWDAGPSKLYDALASVLGLDALTDAQEALREARLERERAHKAAKTELALLLDQLRDLDDERAARCLDALDGRDWDLDTAASQLGSDEPSGDTELLRRLVAIEPPSPDKAKAAATGLSEARNEAERVADTDAGRARQTADLLQRALDHHSSHGDEPCPVCKSGTLDTTWADATRDEIARLRETAAEADAAQDALRQATTSARRLCTRVPEALQRAGDVGIDATDAAATWKEWSHTPDEPSSLQDHLQHAGRVHDEVVAVQQLARLELDRREDAWRPLAASLGAWLAAARPAVEGATKVKPLKAAEAWVKKTSAEIRDARFAPIGGRAQQIWNELRMESNVELGAVRLDGVPGSSQRRVTLDVTVDGTDGSALGVMSQGELNSLALSLFLPRASLPESSFRFVMIDDPVQAMDPTKVDGLARVLDAAAQDRQVVVFTHDARLSEAIKRLDIDARILEVRRGEGSAVTIEPCLDPVTRHLWDARRIAKATDLDPKIVARVVPGMLRKAIEAACIAAVRRRRLSRGDAHTALEDDLRQLRRLNEYVALAFFDDAERHGDVRQRIKDEFGPEGDRAYTLCLKGAHEAIETDLLALHSTVQRMVRKLERLS